MLDAWALMSWIEEEPSANVVQAMLDKGAAGSMDLAMCMINTGEVYYALVKQGRGEAAERLLAELDSMPIRMLVPSKSLIIEAARIKSRFPISYADAFAVATARHENASLVTGDPELRIFQRPSPQWEPAPVVAGIVEIEWIGNDD